jgi:5'-nucleotidase (lipoprotein e(P4) family)
VKKLVLVGSILLAVGCISSVRTSPPPAAAPAPQAGPAAAMQAEPAAAATSCCRDTHEQLQGTLWMQTAAEYRVLTETTYRAAAAALAVALAEPAWTAAIEQTGDVSALPPAIILDLDETVLDNSRFQGEQVLRRSPYSSAAWKEWVALEAAGIVPGAKPFLDLARDRGVAIYYLSNRSVDDKAHTIANLAALGLAASADNVMCLGESGWTSDKTARRALVAGTHRVVMMLGDDLSDFIPAKLSPERRVDEAEKHNAWWGSRWFLLPNPMYGTWERALYGNESGLSDREILLRKLARVRGMHN